jgi:TonB family protein
MERNRSAAASIVAAFALALGGATAAAPAPAPGVAETILDAHAIDDTGPKALKVLTAAYPATIEARFTINKVGRTQGIQTLPPTVPQELHDAAQAAIASWSFWPALGACRHVEQQASVTMVFEETRVEVGKIGYLPLVPRALKQAEFAWLDPSDPGDARPRNRTARAGFTETVPLKVVQPRFPAKASRQALSGYSFVMLEVGSDGRVLQAANNDAWAPDPKLAPQFGAEAVRAVKQWRFQPAMQDGKPMRRWACHRVLFNMKLGG